ncbi:MAG TPA: hypothetical protein VIW69_20445, partial [Candidatus Elarobacter sp.]
MAASQRLKSQNASPDDAQQALNKVDAGLSWNEQACRVIAGRSAADNANRQQMYQVNKAFLLSLKAQAQTVRGDAGAAATYAAANRELSACAASGKLSGGVQANCKTQLANNRASQQTGAADTNNPCEVALKAANDAGEALKPKDYANFERAYLRAADGIAANKNCTRSPQMRDVNSAYLLTWKAVADRYLDVPYNTDRDFANPADPFA